MKRLFVLPVLLLAMLMGHPALGADLQKGLDAYNRGDFATALKEWAPLAKQGNPDAQSNLGAMHYNGQGVSKNYKTATKWYKLAAKQGYARAQNGLGLIYANGRGVPQDYKAAIKWYELAAEQNSARAQNSLGLMHYHGRGVPRTDDPPPPRRRPGPLGRHAPGRGVPWRRRD